MFCLPKRQATDGQHQGVLLAQADTWPSWTVASAAEHMGLKIVVQFVYGFYKAITYTDIHSKNV